MAKKTLSLGQIFNVNMGSAGIQFAWALAVANISGIYGFFGAKVSDLGYLWLAFPIAGLLFQLITGYVSDRTRTRYGKRLPYILGGAIATAICMFLLPNSLTLYMAFVLVFLFTAAVNVALQPFRPLVADVASEKIHTKVYAIQAGMIGIGATFASLAPWILINIFGKHVVKSGSLPFEVKFSFYIGAFVLLATSCWTFLTVKAYLPKTVAGQKVVKAIDNIGKIKKFFINLKSIPKIMLEVAIIEFCIWIGIFCFIIYITPVLERTIFALPLGISVKHHAAHKIILEKSIVLTGIISAIYTFVSMVFAYCIPYLSKQFTRKYVFIATLLIGGISIISVYYIHSVIMLFIAMIGVGVAWASMMSIPYAMIAAAIPEEKLGAYMGIFNISICLPQLVVGLFAGYMLNTILHHDVLYLMLIAGGFFILGGLLTIPVRDRHV